MKKILFAALIFCTSLLVGEIDPRVKPEDDTKLTSTGSTTTADPQEFSFTEEPMEEEVVEDQAFLELL